MFRFDSGFMKIMDNIGKFVILNIVFLFSCIPVLSVGVAIEGMYYSLFKWIAEKDDRVFYNYVKGIKRKWKQSLFGEFLVLAVTFVFVLEFKGISLMPEPWRYLLSYIAGFTALCVGIIVFYYFQVLSRIDAPVWKVISVSFAGGTRCLLHTVALGMLTFLEVFALTFSVYLVPVWIVCGFAVFAWIRAHIFLWVFEKIRIYKKPKEDEG